MSVTDRIADNTVGWLDRYAKFDIWDVYTLPNLIALYAAATITAADHVFDAMYACEMAIVRKFK